MNILHMISGGDTGGAKTHVFALMNELPKMCNVKIVCFIKGQFFDELQNIDVDSELIEQKSRFDLGVLDRLCQIIREDGIDIVHAHGARANFIASRLKKKQKVPVITTVHSDYLLDFDGLYKKLLYTSLNVLSLKKLDYYIAVSSQFKHMLVSRGFRPNSVHTVYNGMDYSMPINYCTKEEFARRIGIEYSKDVTYVGLIGRHDYVKGHDIFLKGAAKVLEKRKDVHFVIAGDGEGRDELVKLIQELGIQEKVTFAGFIKDIYSFINFVDINTLTSRSESFPYVLMEGARLEKPTISSRVGGIPDLIEDGTTGCLFESENYTELARKIVFLVENKETREEYGKALYQRAISRFSSKGLAESHVAIYKAILRDYREKDRYDAVLSGYYGFHNSGDDALLLGIVESLKRQMPDIRLAVLSKKPDETKLFCGVDSVQRFNFFKLRRVIKKSKMLINGGGSLIQDVTSNKSLMYYLYVMKLAKSLGKKVYIYANGFGPLSDKNLKKAASVVGKADLITLRDEMSASELERMAIKGVETHITADPALLLQPVSKQRAQNVLLKEGIDVAGKELMCVAVRPWQKNDGSFCEKMARVCDYAYEKWQLEILFLPMKPQSDTKICESIMEKTRAKTYLVRGEYTVYETLGIISLCNIVAAMRLHSLIYALGAAVPGIGISYDPKIDGFLKYVGNDDIFSAQDIDVDGICRCIDDNMTNKQQKRQQAELAKKELCVKAEQNAALAKKLLEM